jgi:hypothetical protein
VAEKDKVILSMREWKTFSEFRNQYLSKGFEETEPRTGGII